MAKWVLSPLGEREHRIWRSEFDGGDEHRLDLPQLCTSCTLSTLCTEEAQWGGFYETAEKKFFHICFD
jgi:hypothetical protein